MFQGFNLEEIAKYEKNPRGKKTRSHPAHKSANISRVQTLSAWTLSTPTSCGQNQSNS